jgi:hypothetical protein
VKQVLHVGQLVTIGAHVFCLSLLKAETSKINIWRGPSQLGQIALLEMGTFIWKNIV